MHREFLDQGLIQKSVDIMNFLNIRKYFDPFGERFKVLLKCEKNAKYGNCSNIHNFSMDDGKLWQLQVKNDLNFLTHTELYLISCIFFEVSLSLTNWLVIFGDFSTNIR